MNAILSPLLEHESIELSEKPGLWKKQILPAGKFNYKGETIDFDEIGREAKSAFDAKALDQVAFQLADSGNNHNFDPRNYRGELVDVDYQPGKGTFGVYDFSKFPDVQDLLTKNPKFGVSAQIERNLERGDGKKFKYAFSHVLGTLNPRVTGMKPWERVQLSNDANWDEVLDLSATEVKSAVTDTKKEEKETYSLSKEEYEKFQTFLKTLDEVEESEIGLSNGEDGEEQDEAITLANQRAEDALKLARQSEIKLAKSEWNSKSAELVRDGVPPKMLELAQPLMERPDSDVKSIQLSNSESLDPKSIVLSVLEEAKGTIDLSAAKGHEYNGSEDGEENDPAWKAFRDQFFADQF